MLVLNQTNFSGTPAYINAYDKALAELAYERYQRDITLLGYEDEVKNMIEQLPA